MLYFLPGYVKACLAGTLYFLLNMLLPIPLFGFALLKLFPVAKWQRFISRLIEHYCLLWGSFSHGILRLLTQIEWDIQGLTGLSPQKSYLVICNHQSWLDIVVLQEALNRKIPTSRYFVKKNLLKVPIIGWACRIMGFPAMHRFSKALLLQHPELRGKDIAATHKACAKLKEQPVTLVNFVEGTRLTATKKAKQQSPYQHLLRPKAGGLSFAMSALGDYLDEILNVTLVYSQEPVNIVDFFCGKLKKVTVRAEVLAFPRHLIGDYQNDAIFRSQFQTWLNELWQQKDNLITTLKKTQGIKS